MPRDRMQTLKYNLSTERKAAAAAPADERGYNLNTS